MDTLAAARRWAEVWQRGWQSHQVDPIAALYDEGAVYRSHPFRDPEPSARSYAERAFAGEDSVECRFGDPIAQGDRAAVEWWAVYTTGGEKRTLAGVTILRFGPGGQVVEHADYWAEEAGSRPPLF